ncbi:MAG: hypothetical protein Q8922_13780 [Bacteroidota bacterium]|nr:hypothetical protein [Bacteroidota bacterium]MDP4288992.1 hypothetical protein [Bacteroidota bacterium]
MLLLLESTTGQAQGMNSTKMVDSVPTTASIAVHSVVAEAMFAGAFFGLQGNKILLGRDWGGGIEELAPAAAVLSSAAATVIWGNALHLGHNDFWRVLVGEFAGAAMGFGITVNLTNFPVARYIASSTFCLAGGLLAYYLWPPSHHKE